MEKLIRANEIIRRQHEISESLREHTNCKDAQQDIDVNHISPALESA